MQQVQVNETERLRRQEYTRDTRASIALGLSYDEYVKLHEASVEDWSTWIYAEMGKAKAIDPQEIMPRICARLEQRCAQISREVANLAATEIVRERLKRAIK
jgi:hypothetical protein